MTMIEDGVVEAVFSACGLAATGLYTYLERRVGLDGTWTCAIKDLAAACNQTERHVRAAITALEQSGFLVRETVLGKNGICTGVKFFLPKHLRTYYRESVPAPQSGPGPRQATNTDNALTPKQQGMIFALADKQDIDADDEAEARYGVPVSRLSRRDASAFIDVLQAKAPSFSNGNASGFSAGAAATPTQTARTIDRSLVPPGSNAETGMERGAITYWSGRIAKATTETELDDILAQIDHRFGNDNVAQEIVDLAHNQYVALGVVPS